MTVQRTRSILLLVVSLMGLIGCQAASTPNVKAAAAPRRAVLISGGHGNSTVVVVESETPGSPIMFGTPDAPTCPTCKADVAKYFESGSIDPVCPTCGASRKVLAPIVLTRGR